MTEQAGTDPAHSPGSDPVGHSPTGPEASTRPDPNSPEPSTTPAPHAEAGPASEPSIPASGTCETTAAPAPVLPRPHRWPVRWLVLGSAFVVLLAVAATAIVVIATDRVTAFTARSASLVRAGTQQLLAAPMVRYRGNLLNEFGHLVRLDAIFSRNGDALLDLHLIEDGPEQGGSALVVLHRYHTIVRADRGWWLVQDADEANWLADHWTENGRALSFDPHSLLSPQRLAGTLRAGLAGKPASAFTLPETRPAATIGGVRATAVTTAAHTTVYVSQHKPYRLVGLDGPLVEPTGTDDHIDAAAVATAAQVSLAVSVPDTKEQATLTSRMTRTWRAAAVAAKRPPAEITSFDVHSGQVNCTSAGTFTCSLPSSVQRGDFGPAKVRAVYLVSIAADPDGIDPLGSCFTLTRPLASGDSARASCTVRDPRLRDYSDEPLWGFAIAYDQTGLGIPPEQVLSLFERGLFNPPGDYQPVREALTVLDAFSTDDWPIRDAFDVVNAATTARMLPLLYRLVQSGNFRFDSKPLTDFLDAAGSSPGGREWDALQEAARRSGTTTGTVSVGSWQGTDGLSYRADVIDTGAKESVQIAAVRSDADLSATRHQISGAAKRFRGHGTPPGYHRVLQVVLAPGHQLYRADRAGVRAGLRAAGLKAGELNGARLTVSGQHGTSTFTAADFR